MWAKISACLPPEHSSERRNSAFTRARAPDVSLTTRRERNSWRAGLLMPRRAQLSPPETNFLISVTSSSGSRGIATLRSRSVLRATHLDGNCEPCMSSRTEGADGVDADDARSSVPCDDELHTTRLLCGVTPW